MSWFTLIIIALGLGMDALSVAVAVGARAAGRLKRRQLFRLSFHFGLFQMLMPLAGWLGGRTLTGLIGAYDHWIAFALLSFVGVNMIREGYKDEEQTASGDPTRGLSLIMLSLATSIDALAVGFSFALLNVNIWQAVLVIGFFAAAMTLTGMLFGKFIGTYLGKKVEWIGGLILIAIGLKILGDHLFG